MKRLYNAFWGWIYYGCFHWNRTTKLMGNVYDSRFLVSTCRKCGAYMGVYHIRNNAFKVITGYNPNAQSAFVNEDNQ